MSNLIPQKRVNKNGVAVTKHVRAAPKIGPSVKLPVPSVGTGEPRAATPALDEAIKLTEALLENRGKKALQFTLDDLDPEAVQRLEDLLVADDKMRPRSYVISSGVTTALSKDTVEECVAFMHNVTVFGDTVSGPESNSVTGLLQGLERYPDSTFPHIQDYLLDATEDQRKNAKRLLEFTIKASKVAGGALVYDSFMDNLGNDGDISDVYLKLEDDGVAAYVVEHPEHEDAILEMIEREGRALPVEVIDGRLNHDVQAIREGFL